MTLFATRAAALSGDSAERASPYRGPERRRRISVLLVTNEPSLADVFRPSLEQYRAVQFINTLAANATQINEAIERRMPRILLLDERLLAETDSRIIGSITTSFPRLRVLLVCNRENEETLDAVVKNRFHGILKTTAPAELCVKALFKVNRGEYWLPRRLLEQALFAPQPRGRALDLALDGKLSKREAETVRHLCDGMTNRQIADALGIREDTVKKHLHKAYTKLDVQNRTQLIARMTSRASSI
jgi:DNA-binding NarL/FixJ family response regulator